MARRRIVDEPTSRLAVWARRCALFSLAATVLAILIVRSGILEIVPALATFAGALMLSVVGIVLAFGAFIVIWRDGTGGLGHAVTAIAIGVALISYPAYLGARAYNLPMINDVTTDPLDPPRFDVLSRLRPRGTVEYAGLYAAEQQRTAYPDIESLLLSATPQVAYEQTLAIVNRRKWRVVDERPPQARRDGKIEAVARTAIMGFRDDVSIRIRQNPDGAVIDVRSASRYGRHDLGANASRIRGLLEEIDTRISEMREPKQQQQQPPQRGKPQPQPQARREAR